MKVIRDPKAAGWKAQISCGECFAVLEVVASDVYVALLGSGMDDFNQSNCYVVDCGVCGHFIELNYSTLPEWVRRERKDARKPS